MQFVVNYRVPIDDFRTAKHAPKGAGTEESDKASITFGEGFAVRQSNIGTRNSTPPK